MILTLGGQYSRVAFGERLLAESCYRIHFGRIGYMPKFSVSFLFFVKSLRCAFGCLSESPRQPKTVLAAIVLLGAVAKGLAMSRPDTKNQPL